MELFKVIGKHVHDRAKPIPIANFGIIGKKKQNAFFTRIASLISIIIEEYKMSREIKTVHV